MSAYNPALFDSITAPEPLSPLKNVIITPENVATEARLNRAKPLSRRQIKQLEKEARRLESRAAKQGKNRDAQMSRFLELRSILSDLATQRDALKPQLEAAPLDTELQNQYEAILDTAAPLNQEYQALRAALRSIIDLEKQVQAIRQQIDDNPKVIARKLEEDRLTADQQKEARIYEQFLINRLTKLGYCYRRRDKNGNELVDEVRFAWCEITPDAIYYKIDVARGTLFGGWKDQLPYGVRVADLLHPDTCFELSQSCGRQVTSKSTAINGAWLIVHRLDTNDGLVSQVRYASVLELYPRQHHDRIPICVGVGYNLKIQWLFITEYPHMLVAGFTGSGKSNFINALICMLISQHSPDELRIVLVDLKDGIEFSAFEKIPHLHGKVVDNVGELADRLQELEAIMGERNRLMRGRAKNILQFNAKFPAEKLPRVICIVDETASIMGHGDTSKRINGSLRQLTAKGRAAGIHIILSTQRPSVDSIEGNIKVNMAARIVGRMPSHVDSQTVLGTGDAKELANVPGRMILQVDPDPRPVQTPLIEEEDIVRALKKAMEYPTPEPLPVPENYKTINEWTPERIVELSLNFLGGNMGYNNLWAEIKDEGALTRDQLRDMVKRIWAMDCIALGDKFYRVERSGRNLRRLVEIPQTANQPENELSPGG